MKSKVLDKYTPLLHVISKFLISSGFPVDKCLLLLSTDHLANSKQLNNPTMNTKIPTKLLSLVAAASLAASASFAQDNAVTSDVVGYLSTTCLGGSDTIVSLPLHKTSVATTTVTSVNSESSQITVALSTMTADQYKDSHYIRFGEGAGLEGAKFTVSANTSDTLTLDPVSGYNLSSVAVDDVLELIPHITLSELFASVDSIPDQTEVFYFNNAVSGINKSTSGGYIYDAGDWYDASTYDAAANAVIYPDDTYIVRVQGNSANDFKLTLPGSVPDVGHSFAITTPSAGPSDNLVSPQIPAATEIATLFPNATQNDEILIFDNSVRAINKSSSGGYIYDAGAWYDASTFDAANTVKIKPWELAVYRRANQGSSSAVIFSGRASYLDNL